MAVALAGLHARRAPVSRRAWPREAGVTRFTLVNPLRARTGYAAPAPGGRALLEMIATTCPYCGEPLALLVDASAGPQAGVEDCAVCCRPMLVEMEVDAMDAGGMRVRVRRDDDA